MQRITLSILSLLLAGSISAQTTTVEDIFEHFADLDCAQYMSIDSSMLALALDESTFGGAKIHQMDILEATNCDAQHREYLKKNVSQLIKSYKPIIRMRKDGEMTFIGSKKIRELVNEFLIFDSDDSSFIIIRGDLNEEKFIEVFTGDLIKESFKNE